MIRLVPIYLLTLFFLFQKSYLNVNLQKEKQLKKPYFEN